jgi:hypothetical protein
MKQTKQLKNEYKKKAKEANKQNGSRHKNTHKEIKNTTKK